MRLDGGQGSGDGGQKRPEYGVTFISAGYVRRRDGAQSNWKIPPEALLPAVGMFNGAANFIDHASLASWFYPQIKDMAGVCFAAKWNADRLTIDGGLRLSRRPDLAWYQSLLDEYLEDQEAGREVPDVGFSAVLYQDSEWVDGEEGEALRLTTAIKHVESCDTVFGPGAEGRLREALSSLGQFISIPQLKAEGGRRKDEKEAISASPGLRSAVLHPSSLAKNGGDIVDEVLQESAVEPVVQPAAVLVSPVGAAVAAASAGPVGVDLSPVLALLQQQQAQLQQQQDALVRLTSALAVREEGSVVQGMGHAPRDPAGGPGRTLRPGSGQVWGMATSLDRFAPAVDWLFGVPDAPYPDPQFRKADMVYQALCGDWEWRGIFDPSRVMLAGVNATDLPNLAVNAMNKVIMVQYASLRAYRWYELVTAPTPNDGSTQDLTLVSVGGVGALPTVAEKGAYTELTMADARETASFVKKGGYVGITLEMFRKSEIAKIQAVPSGLARSAVMTRSAAVANIFTSNAGVGPTLAVDSKALFHTDHGNVAATAFGTDSTAWNAVDLAIWSQVELGSGKPLAISPKYMLCHRALLRAALVVFGYGDGQPTTYVPEAVDRGPDDPRPWPVAVPDFTDANDWAAVVDPQLYPVIQMSYAQALPGNNHPAPEVYAALSPDTSLIFLNDTFPVKVRDWFAVGVNGYRGIAKRNVA